MSNLDKSKYNSSIFIVNCVQNAAAFPLSNEIPYYFMAFGNESAQENKNRM